jgi:ribonuclease HI
VARAFTLRTDGGARGNPGPAGAGFVLEDGTGTVVRSGGRFLGTRTNNAAEYEALVWGLETALDEGARDLSIRADSELMVKQVSGLYRVKNEGLRRLHARAKSLLASFDSYEIVHVRREENAAADALANIAMDERRTVGDGIGPERDAQAPLF